jgi:hypothetical protein
MLMKYLYWGFIVRCAERKHGLRRKILKIRDGIFQKFSYVTSRVPRKRSRFAISREKPPLVSSCKDFEEAVVVSNIIEYKTQ